jgi:DNA-binding CsgD family transcriptional regulator
MERVVPAVVLAAAPQGPGAASDSPTLTARQREVLQLVAQELSNREIAARMDLSEPTIKNYVEGDIHKTCGSGQE